MATIFTDNFNSYNNGNLDPQGGWTHVTDAAYTVEASTVFEGAKAIKNGAGDADYKIGTAQIDGTMTFYFMSDSSGGAQIRLYENGQGGSLRVYTSINGAIAGAVAYYDGDAASFVSLATTPVNTWTAFQIQWRSSDHKVRYNLNGGTWTAWTTPFGAWSGGLDTVYLGNINGSTGNFYFDTFQENLFAQTFTSSPSDSIMNGASRSSTLAGLGAHLRSMVDSIMNGASRLTSVSFYKPSTYSRSLSDSIMNAKNRFILLYQKIISIFSQIFRGTDY